MYPKIFSKTEYEFSTNGYGFLSDVIKLLVTEERNGGYFLEMEYPLNGKNYQYLKYDFIILVKPNPLDRPQPFRIYDTKKSKSNRRIYVKAKHITFDDAQNFILSCSGKMNAHEILNSMMANRTQQNKIHYSTDIGITTNFNWNKKSPTNAIAGEEGSFIQVCGGEIRRDLWNVEIKGQRGRKSNYVARDEKGLIDFDLEEDISEVVTKLYPFKTYKPEGSDKEISITLKEKYIQSSNLSKYPFERIAFLDLSQDESIQNEDDLRKAAEKKFTQDHIDLPKISGNLKIVNTTNSPEYKFITNISSIMLCDYIWCISNVIKEKVQVQVNKVIYNPIIEEYDSIEVGVKKLSLAQSISNSIQSVQNQVNNVQTAIDNMVVDDTGAHTIQSSDMPTEDHMDLKDGDIWFQVLPDGSLNSWVWDDTQKIWKPLFNQTEFNQAQEETKKAIAQANAARDKANQAVENANDAIKKAEQANTGIDALNESVEKLKQKDIELNTTIETSTNALENKTQALEQADIRLGNTIADVQTTVNKQVDGLEVKVEELANTDANNILLGTSSEFESFDVGKNTVDTTSTNGLDLVLQPNTTYTYSILTGSGNTRLELVAQCYDNNQHLISEETEYAYIQNKGVLTFTTPTNVFKSKVFFRGDGSGSIDVKCEKLEKGKVATEWTPAQADLDTKMTQITTTIEGIEAKVEDTTKGLAELKITTAGIGTKVQDNAGNISKVAQVAQGLKTELTDAKGHLNTVISTASSNTSRLTNAEGKLNQTVQTVEGNKREISNVKGEITSIKETTQGLEVVIANNANNLWTNPTFEFGSINAEDFSFNPSEYHEIQPNPNKQGVAQDRPSGISVEYNVINSSDKALKFKVTDNKTNNDVYTIEYFPAAEKEVFNISFDYIKQAPNSTVNAGFALKNSSGKTINWTSIYTSTETINWKRKTGQITIPSGKGITQIQPYVALNYGTAGGYAYIDNVYITRQSEADKEIQSSITNIVATSEGLKRDIANTKGEINSVKSTVAGTREQIKTANNQILELTKTAQGMQTTIANFAKNATNLFPIPTFEGVQNLADYGWYNDKIVHLAKNDVKTSATETQPTGAIVDYKCQNSSSTAIRFEHRNDANNDFFVKDMFDTSDGEVFNVSFSYFKEGPSTATVGFKCVDKDNKIVSWIGVQAKVDADGSWRKKVGQLVIPGGKGIVKVQPYLSYDRADSGYAYIDNVYITRQSTVESGVQKSVNTLQSTAQANIAKIERLNGNYNSLTQTIQMTQSKISDNTSKIESTKTQLAGVIDQKITSLDSKLSSQITQTNELINLQSSKLGYVYPNFSSRYDDIQKYYELSDGTDWEHIYLSSFADEKGNNYVPINIGTVDLRPKEKKGIRLKEYINVEDLDRITFSFKSQVRSDYSPDQCKAVFYIVEYNSSKQMVKNNFYWVRYDTVNTEYLNSVDLSLGSSTKYIRPVFVVEQVAYYHDFELQIYDINCLTNPNSLTGQIAIANDNINLSVRKNDVINQINVSTEGVLIQGKKVHITGQTTIDNAVIKDAMIQNISASKLTAGTIDASKINVINLNANNITGNRTQFVQSAWNSVNSSLRLDGNGLTCSTSEDKIMLNNSVIKFATQRDNGYSYISADNNSKSLTIGTVKGESEYEHDICLRSYGRDCVMVKESNTWLTGKAVFVGGGLRTQDDFLKNTNNVHVYGSQNVDVLSLNKVVIGTANTFNDDYTPRQLDAGITISEDGNGGYVRSETIYSRTYSSSPNVYITEYGTLGRSVSSKKYKKDIEDFENLDQAKQLLQLKPKSWKDKKEHKSVPGRHYGFIAEDLDELGLKEVVRYENGEVEGLAYDRFSIYTVQLIKDLYNRIEELEKNVK